MKILSLLKRKTEGMKRITKALLCLITSAFISGFHTRCVSPCCNIDLMFASRLANTMWNCAVEQWGVFSLLTVVTSNLNYRKLAPGEPTMDW